MIGLGQLAFGLVIYLTVAFACAFVGAALGTWAVLPPARPGRRGLHPLVVGVLVTAAFAAILGRIADNLLISQRTVNPDAFRVPLLFAFGGVVFGAALVARIGHAREVLGSAYLATFLSTFALPFVGSLTSTLQVMPSLIVTDTPATLGLLGGMVWTLARQRQRLAYTALSRAEPSKE
jgi:integral membrane sensor domain MASE1